VLRGQPGELLQPREVVLAALRLVIVPPEAPAPGVDAELPEEREIERDAAQVLALVVVLEDGEREPLREDTGAAAGARVGCAQPTARPAANETRRMERGRRMAGNPG